jgi:Carbohydrate binding domain
MLAALIGCGGDDEQVERLPSSPLAGTESDVAPPPIGTELLMNGNFEQGFASWDTYLENPNNADYAVDAGEAIVDVHAVAIDTGGIQLKYTSGLNLHQGTEYRLSFRARATPNRTISTSIWENGHDLNGNGSEWSTRQWNDHSLTSTMTAFAVEWVMPVTNTDAGLCFFMGDPESVVILEDGRAVIDDVSLVAVE